MIEPPRNDGRTVWWAKDAAWWRREYVIELGEEFGASGPAVLDWLTCEAKAQNDGGWVKAGFRSLARGAFTDHATACHVVSRSFQLGAIDDLEADGRRFTCRISGWKQEQDRARAAARQAARRASVGVDDTGSAVTDATPSRSVTSRSEKSLTGQDRINGTPPTPRDAGGAEQIAPSPPEGKRKREQARYTAQIDAFAAEHFPDLEPGLIRSTVGWLRGARVSPTVTAIRDHLQRRGHASEAAA